MTENRINCKVEKGIAIRTRKCLDGEQVVCDEEICKKSLDIEIAYLIDASAVGVLLLILSSPVDALKPQSSYSLGECELIAKDINRELGGGSILFIVPLKSNGAYQEVGYKTNHIINVRVIHGKTYYIDYFSQEIMTSRQEVCEWYKELSGFESESYDLAYENPPFQVYYNYA